MPAKTLDTSITDAATRRFLKNEPERATLWCERITGFHILKVKTGGSWRYRYQTADGKRRVATIGRYPAMKPQQAAEKALAWRNENVDALAVKAKRTRNALTEAQKAEQRTLRAYLEGPYARYQERKRSGAETLRLIRHNFTDWLDRDMATLDSADVKAWQAKREAEGRAYSTLQRAYGALKTMLNRAAKHDDLLDANPLRDVHLEAPRFDEVDKQVKAEQTARRLLSDEEVTGLHEGLRAFADELRRQRRNSRAHGKPDLPDLDAVDYPHWFIPFCHAALYTGLRPGDLYALTWAELNPTFGRLNVIPQKTRHHRNPARVTMDLVPELLEVVRAWWAQQGKPDTGLVFPSPVTGLRMDKKAHLKAWRRVKRLGGLPDDLDFYTLRHNFISKLVAAGVPLLTVAQLVGHKSAGMIEQHYGDLCPTVAADALAVFSKSVTPKQEAV
ncbi:tyrosine-type recombinase/integrase [Alkalilimnicola ehrlichii]|uniref:tyrosine-type recombinase/integrase n=1 Tax=Alkalilimnicola ehrlichii TaxID=351052 RepID=UPI003BA06046